MKKLVYLICGLSLLFGSGTASAQSFLTASGSNDTVTDFVRNNQDVDINNPIHSASATPVYIKWTVQSFSAPAGVTAQFCDNIACTNAVVNQVHVSNAYTATPGGFHATFLGIGAAPANSIAYITLIARDTVASYQRMLTFRIYKPALGVANTAVSSDDVTLYPNPAHEAVNVLYNSTAGVETIAIYNLIGKVMKVFRPLDNNSARLDLDNIPTGVYFVRMIDVNGRVLATRRFTRQ